MENLFYFTKFNVELDDIAKVADQLGYEAYKVNIAYEDVVVEFNENNYCRWSKLTFAEFTNEENKRKIREYKPTSGFIILYEDASWEALKQLFSKILELYNGWIGFPDDWKMVYTLENFDSLTI
jgi:hypothetical protein